MFIVVMAKKMFNLVPYQSYFHFPCPGFSVDTVITIIESKFLLAFRKKRKKIPLLMLDIIVFCGYDNKRKHGR